MIDYVSDNILRVSYKLFGINKSAIAVKHFHFTKKRNADVTPFALRLH